MKKLVAVALSVIGGTVAVPAAITPAQAHLLGISLNGPHLAGIALNGPSANGTALPGVVAPDASGMRILTVRMPSGATLTAK